MTTYYVPGQENACSFLPKETSLPSPPQPLSGCSQPPDPFSVASRNYLCLLKGPLRQEKPYQERAPQDVGTACSTGLSHESAWTLYGDTDMQKYTPECRTIPVHPIESCLEISTQRESLAILQTRRFRFCVIWMSAMSKA